MTMPGGGAPGGTGTWRRMTVRAAVVTAFGLAKLRPGRLRAVLERVAAGAEPADPALAEEAFHAVVDASRRCAGWRGCLPRSVAVALLCRGRGTWPEWCAGVRSTPPFAAHAWVESGGRLIAEPGEPSAYSALIRVTAGRSARSGPAL